MPTYRPLYSAVVRRQSSKAEDSGTKSSVTRTGSRSAKMHGRWNNESYLNGLDDEERLNANFGTSTTTEERNENAYEIPERNVNVPVTNSCATVSTLP